uniref:uncharacterized protein n=1 Tax=Myxine glutinosa TaxID=7769 RepID=UPI00358EAFF8
MVLPGRQLPHDALPFVNYQKHDFPNHPPPAYPLLPRHTTQLAHNRGQPRPGHNRGQPRPGHNRGQPRPGHNQGLPRTQVKEEYSSHDASMKSFGVLKRRKGSNSRFKVKTNANENINVVLGETNRARTHLNLQPGDLLGKCQKDSWIHGIKDRLLKIQDFGKGKYNKERNCDELQNEMMIGFVEEPWFGHYMRSRKGGERKCPKRNVSSAERTQAAIKIKMVGKTNNRKSGILECGHVRRVNPPSYDQHCAIVMKCRRRAARRLQETLRRTCLARHAQSHHNQWEKDERCSEEAFWSDPDNLLFGPRSNDECSRSCSWETHVDWGPTKLRTQGNEMQLEPRFPHQGTKDNRIRTLQSTSDFTVPQYQQHGLNGRLTGQQDKRPAVWAPQQEVASHGCNTQAAYQGNHFGRGFYNKVKQQSFKDSYTFPVADPCFKNRGYRSLPSWPTSVGYCQGMEYASQVVPSHCGNHMTNMNSHITSRTSHMTMPLWKLPCGSRKTTIPEAKMSKVDIFKTQPPGLGGQSLRSSAYTNQPLLPQPHYRPMKDGIHGKGSYSLDHCSEQVWNRKKLLVIIDASAKHVVTQYLCPNQHYCAGSTSWIGQKQEQPSKDCKDLDMSCKGFCDGARPSEPQNSEAQSGKPQMQTKKPAPIEYDASTSNSMERSHKDPHLSELAERATNVLRKPVTEEMVALLARKLLQLASKEAQLDDDGVNQERVLPTNNETCAHDKGMASYLECENISLRDAEPNLQTHVLSTTIVNSTLQGAAESHNDKHTLLGASQPVPEGGGVFWSDVKTKVKYYTYFGRTMSEVENGSNDCRSQHGDYTKQNAFYYSKQEKDSNDGSEAPLGEQGTDYLKDLYDNGSDSSSTSAETVLSSGKRAISCLPHTIEQCNPDPNWSPGPGNGDNQDVDMLSRLQTCSGPTMSLSGSRVKEESSAEGCTTDGLTWNFAYAVCLRKTDEGNISTRTDCGNLEGEIDEQKRKAEAKQRSGNPEKDENVWTKVERNDRNNEEVDWKQAVGELEKPAENEKKENSIRVDEREQQSRNISLTVEGTKEGTGRTNEIEIGGRHRTGAGGEAKEGLNEGTMVEHKEKLGVESRKREVQDKKGNRKMKRQSSARCTSQ